MFLPIMDEFCEQELRIVVLLRPDEICERWNDVDYLADVVDTARATMDKNVKTTDCLSKTCRLCISPMHAEP